MNRRFRHALTSWIASLAILFGMLAPALSQALPAAPDTIVFPVCSAAGHAGDLDTGADSAATSFKHCPFCTDGHHVPGLLPQAPAALLAVGGPVVPSLFYRAPEPLFHWAATKSRGPPIVS